MTCVGSSKEDILTVTDDMKQAGLSHVLALRGDRPTWMDDAQFENRAFVDVESTAQTVIASLHQAGTLVETLAFSFQAATTVITHFVLI